MKTVSDGRSASKKGRRPDPAQEGYRKLLLQLLSVKLQLFKMAEKVRGAELSRVQCMSLVMALDDAIEALKEELIRGLQPKGQ